MKEIAEKISRLLDFGPHTFCLLDSELKIIDINIPGMKKWGMGNLKKKDVVGKHILDLVPEAKKTGRYQKLQEVLKTGKPYIVEAMPVHPKFGNKIVNFRAVKVGNGLGVIISDVTERKKAEEALQESEKTLSTSG